MKMQKLELTNNFSVDDLHKIREWNYGMIQSGKKNINEDMILNIISTFPKAKYIKLSDFMKGKENLTPAST